jgi:UDP-GlcNAc:undecaprenyl-phosphate GlcNAc-1-phosphate transferase
VRISDVVGRNAGTAAGRAAAFAAGAGLAQLAYRWLCTDPPGREGTWDRTNHRRETVTLLEGPAFVAAAATAVAITPGLPLRARAAGVVALAAAGLTGLYDDLREVPAAGGTAKAKGLRGHLGALRAGEVTSGAVKIAGIGAGGLIGAGLLAEGPLADRAVDAILGGAVVAGYANLGNLLDLRPGRALKFGLLHAPLLLAPGAGGALVAGPLGAAAGLLPADLGERAMLGDSGANALGGVLGTAVLLQYGRAGRLAHLVVLVALTVASEKVSFTKVIAQTPPLRWVDELGRRPAIAPAESRAAAFPAVMPCPSLVAPA